MKCTECRKEIESAYFLKGMYAKREDPLVPYCLTCKVQLRDVEKKLAFNGVGMTSQSAKNYDLIHEAEADQLAKESRMGLWAGVEVDPDDIW